MYRAEGRHTVCDDSKLNQTTPPVLFIARKHIVHEHKGPNRSVNSHTSQSHRCFPPGVSHGSAPRGGAERPPANCVHSRLSPSHQTEGSQLVRESVGWSESLTEVLLRLSAARCGASLQHLPHPQRHPAAAGRSLRGLQRLLQEQEEHHPGRRDPLCGCRWDQNVQNNHALVLFLTFSTFF